MTIRPCKGGFAAIIITFLAGNCLGAKLPSEVEAAKRLLDRHAGVTWDGPRFHVIRIDLSGTWVTDQDMAVIRAFTRLENLNLYNTNVTDEGLKHISELRFLTTLSVGRPYYGDSDSIMKDEWSPRNITDKSIDVICKLTNLRKLNLALTKITDKGLAKLVSLKELEELDLNMADISDAGFCQLKGLSKVKSLFLYGTKVTAKGLSAASGMRNLHTVTLGRYVAGDAMKHFGNLHELRHLDVSATRIDNESMKYIGNLRNLESLDLPDTVTDASAMHLSNLTNLAELRLGSMCSDITIMAMSKLVKLKVVGLPSGTTDAGLVCLTKSCPNIEQMWLEDAKISWKGIKALVGLKVLRYLSIKGCPVSNKSIRYLAQLERLEFVNLRNTRITGDGVVELIARMKSGGLRSLSTIYLPGGISDEIKAQMRKARSGMFIE